MSTIVVEVTTPALDPTASVVLRLCSEIRSLSVGVYFAESPRSCPGREGFGGDRLPVDATLRGGCMHILVPLV